MMKNNYIRSHFDHRVYFNNLKNESFIYLLLYIVDILITSKGKMKIEKLKAQLRSEYEMKNLGWLKKLLGMEIKRDKVKGIVCLFQKQYLQKLLSKFGIDKSSKIVTIVLIPHFKLNSQLSLHQ